MSRGIPNLRHEIVRRYARNYGVQLDPETEAIVTIGAKDALAHMMFAVIGPGDLVVTPAPCYPIHQYGVIMAEGEAVPLPASDPAEYLNRLEGLLQTGLAPAQDDSAQLPAQSDYDLRRFGFLQAGVGIALKHGTMILHDFAYADLGFAGYKPPSILEVDGARKWP